MRQIWTNSSQRRGRKAWDGLAPKDIVLVIYWSPPIRITCSNCGASLGDYIAYWAEREYGVLLKTSRHYERSKDPNSKDPYRRLTPANPKFDVVSKNVLYAAQSVARFHCRRCNHPTYERNLRKLGKLLFEMRPKTFSID